MNIKKLLISSVAAIGIATMGLGLTAAADEQPVAYEEQYTLPRLPDDIRLSDLRPQGVVESTDGIIESVDSGSYTSGYLYYIYGSLSSSQQAEMDAAANEILDGVDPAWDDLSKIMYVHDVIVSTREYDTTLTKYYAYDNLVNKTSVCQGYAEAMWYLLYKLDIDCRMVTSEKLNHAWNVVCVDGKWYHLDATWDDPLVDVPGRSMHTYFMLSEDAINTVNNSGHNAPDMVFSWYENTGEPSATGFATDTRFDDYFWDTVNKPVLISDGYYYYIDSQGVQRSDKNNNTTLFVDLSHEGWFIKSNTFYFMDSAYCDVAMIGNKLYYNTSTKLQAYDLNTGTTSTVYSYDEYDDTENYTGIYGFSYDNYKFTLVIKDAPYNTTYTGTKTVSIALSAPTIKSIGSSGNNVTLSWNSVSGATSYRVYRATSATGTKTMLKAVTATSYTDTTAEAGKTYYYFVAAYNTNTGVLSGYSAAKSVSINALNSPANVKVVSGGGNATITWDAVSDATSYRVFRSTSLTGTRELVKVRTSTYYIDTAVDTGKTYYYWVMAYNANTGAKSGYSSTRTVKIVDSFAKDIEIKKASVTSTTATLSWDIVPGATSYRIYRRDDSGVRKLIATQSMTEYKDTGLTKGKVYRYEIRAYSATTKALSNYSPIKSVRPIAAPSITSGNVRGKITWAKNLYATSYRVYRANSPTGAKTLLKATQDLTYTDTTAVNGKTYYYFVAAYDNSTGTLSAYSAPKVIKISK